MNRSFFLFTVFPLLTATSLFGQPVYSNRLGTDEGLTQSTCINQFTDSRGLFWIGSMDGLNRYDGKQVKAYQPSPTDTAGLNGGNIQSGFWEDKGQNIWFTTWEAVHRYDRKTDQFTKFQLRDEKGEAILGYQMVWQEPDGVLWVVVHQIDLYRLEPKTGAFEKAFALDKPSTWSTGFGRPDGAFHFLVSNIEEEGALYVVAHLAGRSFRSSKIRFPQNPFDIVPESDSTAWVCGRGFLGLANLEKGTFEPCKNTPDILLASMATLPDGRHLMFGVKTGVLYFHKKNQEFLSKPPFDGLPGLDFNRPVRWANVQPNGEWSLFAQLDGVYFGNARKQKVRTVLRGKSIQTMMEDKSGHLWTADSDGRLYEFSPADQLLAVNTGKPANPDSMRQVQHRFMFFDKEDRGWIGGSPGLQIKLPGQNRFKVCPTPGLVFLQGLQLEDGRVIFTELRGGIYEAKKSKAAECGFAFEKFPTPPSNKTFTTLFQAKNGLLYACRELEGIAVLDPANGFAQARFLPIPGEINHYYEPPGGEFLWISTSNGLVRYSPKDCSIRVFGLKDGLQNSFVLAALPDQSGHLWLSTHRGIIRFSPEKGEFRQFLQSDGLSGLEFREFAGMKRANGEIWFGNMDGISVFDPEKMPEMEAAKRPLITEILINDQAAKGLSCQKTGATNPMEIQAISLGREQNTVSFRFAQPEFGDPKRVSFLYKMAGVDENWVHCGPDETARYPNLPPGNYVFELRGFNSDGVESLEPARLEVVVRPAFWQTAWFRAICLALLAALAYGIYRYRIAHLRREFALRQSVLENENKALESSISRLLAQMNPHFVFNGLNSINSFVMRNEGAEASVFLSQFADLMRMVLDYSAQPKIRLEQEIGFLEKYLAIESQRLDGRLDWEINLAPDVDDYATEIPPMILQPLVENAIWHGISPKTDGRGRILIYFKKENGGLTCTVEDNGVGLDAAPKKHGHESKSQSITGERLALFDRQNGTNSNFTLEGITAPDGSVAGARATLKLGYAKSSQPT